MNNDIAIKMELVMPPEAARAIRAGWKPADSIQLMQRAENVLSPDGFRDTYQRGQGMWTPLDPAYKRRKVQQGFSGEIWKRRGDTYNALAGRTSRVRIPPSGTITQGSKMITVSMSGAGLVSATYEIKKPAAGGYFERLNKLRQWFTISAVYERRIANDMKTYILSWLQKCGFRRL